ncbi:hypothetical protein ABXN37_20090 [Piscinibacter sakaiensis]|uniref:hypothetical protein n=1 Tax=Piscinibacter sakaiensis TaxID=1547922 RepID=UPI0037270D37
MQAVLGADVHGVPEADAAVEAQPSFHVAPVLLDPPADDDADGSGRSAALAPRVQAIPGAQAQWATRGLTVEVLEAAQRARVLATPADGGEGRATIQAAASNVTTYTPAQIRAAYGLPALPASLANLTAAQAAALGAGQTVYIVNARHNPNVAAELAAFNAKFGLPACSSRTLAPGAALPLRPRTTRAGRPRSRSTCSGSTPLRRWRGWCSWRRSTPASRPCSARCSWRTRWARAWSRCPSARTRAATRPRSTRPSPGATCITWPPPATRARR